MAAIALLALAVGGCGEPRGVAPFGSGALYRPAPGASDGAGLTCARHEPGGWVHLELFAHGKVMIVPAGIGVAEPFVRDGAYVRGGRCRYPLTTTEPTGLIGVAQPGLTLGDLFAVWDRPLTRDRLVGVRAPVTVHVDGRPWPGAPADVPLRHHAQIVVQAGGPLVDPHASYTFPPR